MPCQRDNKSEAWRALDGPVLYAHRGANVECPENTLAAFERALELGADVLETDARMTRDGHVVLSHDEDGARTAGVPRAIADCDLAEVKSWQLRASPSSPRSPLASAAAVTTLDEALEALPTAFFNVDVKQRAPDMTERITSLIARHGAQRRVLLTSFEARVLRRLRARYQGPTGLSQPEAAALVLAPTWLLRNLRPPGQRLQMPTRSGPLDLSARRLIDKVHRLGLAVDYWVVNDPKQARQLLQRGADGIVCDDVSELARVFSDAPQCAGWRARHPSSAREAL